MRGAVLALAAALAAACDGTSEPKAPVVAAVAVSSAGTLTAIGATVQLSAVATDAKNATISGLTFTWTSSNNSVASVNGSGVVTAISNGSATITASTGGVSKGTTVLVAQTTHSVAVTPGPDTLRSIGATRQLAGTARDANNQPVAGATFSWGSSDTMVAKVNASGLVTAVGNGSANVSASAGGANGSVAIVVQQAAATVTVSPATGSFDAFGKTTQLTATVKDSGGSAIPGALVAWTSSNSSVVSVSNSGLATAAGNGNATITASSSMMGGTGTFTVAQVATAMVFHVQPPDGFVDSTLSPTVVVELRDANGNRAMNGTSNVTMAVGTNPRGGTLSGTTTRAAVEGRAAFGGLALSRVGQGYTLAATSGALTAASASFNVTPNPRHQGLTMSGVALGGTGTMATVAAGANVSVAFTRSVWNQESCATCITQVVVGIGGSSRACAYDGTPGVHPGVSGNTNLSVAAPAEAGTYLVRTKVVQDFGCTAARASYDGGAPSSENAFGTLVVTDANGLTTQLTNLTVAGRPLLGVVKAGQNATVALDYRVWNQAACPTCLTQVVIGLDNSAKDCAFAGSPGTNPGVSGAATVTFAAPATPGVYDVRYKTVQEFTCTAAKANYDGGPPTTNRAVGTLVVVP